MKRVIYFGAAAVLLTMAVTTHGAESLTQSLQHGLFEEEANHNLDAAIKAYQSVITQSEEQRKVVATALFRLGECYRKLGKTNEANAHYERILRDFSEQEQLVKLSREHVGSRGAGATKEQSGQVSSGGDQEAAELARIKAMIKDSPDLVNSTVLSSASADKLLHQQAWAGRYSVVEFLLANGANVNAGNKSRQTPLHHAAMNGHKKVVEALLAHGADVDAKDETGSTPLRYAAERGYKGVVELLLVNKADVNIAGNGYTPLEVAAKNGFVGVCELLLDRGAPLSRPGKNQPTALHYAAGEGQRAAVELFLKRKVDVNAGDGVGSTPLRWAASNGRADVVKLLLEAGADPNIQNKNGEFPLYGVANLEVMQLLLKHKADPNLKTRYGATALSEFTKQQNVNLQLDAIEILLEKGANPNVNSQNGVPLLFVAVLQRNVRLVELLLDHGADANVMVNAETPIFVAQRSRRSLAAGTDDEQALIDWEQIEKLLLDHGAKENLHLLSGISYERPGWTTPTTFVVRGTPDFNRYTLFEFFGGLWNPSRPNVQLPFADLAHITIARIDPVTSKMKELQINMDEMVESGDCTKDVWLEWGDRISVPERDHALNESWSGPETEVADFLEQCLTRRVHIVVKQETNTVKLVPSLLRRSSFARERRKITPATPAAQQEAAKTEKTVFAFSLKVVVYGAQVLRASSDMTRVRVTRIDPQNKERKEWTIDLTRGQGSNQPRPLPPPPPGGIPPAYARVVPSSGSIVSEQDLWLRDGDVIEIPDKP